MHAHPDHTPTDAGLLLSLAEALPNPNSRLARRAARLAQRLASKGASARAVRRRAADTLAALFAAAEADHSGYTEDGLLDLDFDSL